MNKTSFLTLLLALAVTSGCKPTPRTAGRGHGSEESRQTPPPAATQEEKPKASPSVSLIRVKMATQAYNQLAPWEKEDPATWNAAGVYLGGGFVLTTDCAARSANAVQMTLPDGSRTVPARVVKVDEDAGLALLAPLREEDASFFAGSVPLEWGEPLQVGDEAEVWDTGRGGIPLATPLRVESGGESGKLLPQVNGKVGQMLSEGAPGLPWVKDGRLVGLASGYEAQSQLISSPDLPVIRRFVERDVDAEGGAPVFGASMQTLTDPVFRAFLQLEDDGQGVYISEVEPRSAAAEAGLRVGDVLVSSGGVPIDSRGLSLHPRLGPLSWAALVRGAHGQGETVDLGVRRHGKKMTVPVELNREAADRALMAEEKPGERPRYVMYGGLLLQPVTKNYLDAFQQKTRGRMPYEYLMIEKNKRRYQDEGRKEIVALSRVIPTPATLGYERVAPCIVDAINGVPVHSLEEAADLLDRATPDKIVTISINKAPFTLALDRSAVEASNRYLQTRSLPELRHVKERRQAPPAPQPAETPANETQA